MFQGKRRRLRLHQHDGSGGGGSRSGGGHVSCAATLLVVVLFAHQHDGCEAYLSTMHLGRTLKALRARESVLDDRDSRLLEPVASGAVPGDATSGAPESDLEVEEEVTSMHPSWAVESSVVRVVEAGVGVAASTGSAGAVVYDSSGDVDKVDDDECVHRHVDGVLVDNEEEEGEDEDIAATATTTPTAATTAEAATESIIAAVEEQSESTIGMDTSHGGIHLAALAGEQGDSASITETPIGLQDPATSSSSKRSIHARAAAAGRHPLPETTDTNAINLYTSSSFFPPESKHKKQKGHATGGVQAAARATGTAPADTQRIESEDFSIGEDEQEDQYEDIETVATKELLRQRHAQDERVRVAASLAVEQLPANKRERFDELKVFAYGGGTEAGTEEKNNRDSGSDSGEATHTGLSAEEVQALETVAICGDHDGVVLAFLRHAKFDVQKAKESMRRCCTWRTETEVIIAQYVVFVSVGKKRKQYHTRTSRVRYVLSHPLQCVATHEHTYKVH